MKKLILLALILLNGQAMACNCFNPFFNGQIPWRNPSDHMLIRQPQAFWTTQGINVLMQQRHFNPNPNMQNIRMQYQFCDINGCYIISQ